MCVSLSRCGGGRGIVQHNLERGTYTEHWVLSRVPEILYLKYDDEITLPVDWNLQRRLRCRNNTTQAIGVGSTSCWVKGVESGTRTVLDMGSCEGTLVTPSFNGHDQHILVSTIVVKFFKRQGS